MNIQKISSARNFGHVMIANKEYEKLLMPHKDELDKITDSYDVYIQEEPNFYGFNKYMNENITLYGLPSITIIPYDSANRTIPEVKFVIHPGAGEMQTKDAQAQEMISIIKKGISLYA